MRKYGQKKRVSTQEIISYIYIYIIIFKFKMQIIASGCRLKQHAIQYSMSRHTTFNAMHSS